MRDLPSARQSRKLAQTSANAINEMFSVGEIMK